LTTLLHSLPKPAFYLLQFVVLLWTSDTSPKLNTSLLTMQWFIIAL